MSEPTTFHGDVEFEGDTSGVSGAADSGDFLLIQNLTYTGEPNFTLEDEQDDTLIADGAGAFDLESLPSDASAYGRVIARADAGGGTAYLTPRFRSASTEIDEDELELEIGGEDGGNVEDTGWVDLSHLEGDVYNHDLMFARTESDNELTLRGYGILIGWRVD